jgi:Secretion system C-terminal sorting domain
MMRFLFTLFLLSFWTLNAQAQCLYKLILKDSGGNGWDMGALTYDINGVSVGVTLTTTVDNGIQKEVFIDVNAGDILKINWFSSIFNSEVTIELYDAADQLLITKTNPSPGQLYQTTVACPSCATVTGLYMENIYATSAKARWTAVPNALKYRIIYVVDTLATIEGDTLFSNTPKVTIPALSEHTLYRFYVATICSTTDTSLTAGPYYFETYFSDDLAVTGINLDVINCSMGNIAPSFQLTNLGANPQTLFTYTYTVNGQSAGVMPPTDGLFTGVVGKDSTATIQFETLFNFNSSGEFEVCVEVNMGGAMDDDTTNNRFCKRINNALKLPYAQNFEQWDGGWEATGTDSLISWEHGKPANTFINQAAGGNQAWVTNLDGNYFAGERSYLTSPCFDLSGLLSNEIPVFSCQAIYDLELDLDRVWFEMSTNGGNTWLQQGVVGQGLNWYNSTSTTGRQGWSGNSSGWHPIRQMLTGAQGSSSVMVRFVLDADPLLSLEGFGIDQVQISVPKNNDLATVGLTTKGQNTDCGLAADSISITVANFGLLPANAFEINYTVNGGTLVTQNINVDIQPNQVRVIKFAAPFNSISGVYTIQGSVSLTGDQDVSNNTFNYSVDHRANPLPIAEGFEQGTPADWTVTAGAYATNAHGNISNVLSYNLQSTSQNFVYESPNFGTITVGDTLTYQYRVVDFNTELPIPLAGNSMKVQISTDCGGTYADVDSVNGTNHALANVMTQRGVKLSSFAGDNIKLRFVGKWATGNFYFDLDNIGLKAKGVSVTETEAFGTVKTYPNPTTGFLTIEGESHQAQTLRFTLYNLVGVTVQDVEAPVNQQFAQQFDLTNVPVGMYFLRISDGQHQHTIKVIKSAQ